MAAKESSHDFRPGQQSAPPPTFSFNPGQEAVHGSPHPLHATAQPGFAGGLHRAAGYYALLLPSDAEILKRIWRFYIIAGLLMVVSGMCAIAFPETFTLAMEQMLGWVLSFCGVLLCIHALVVWSAPGTIAYMVLGLLYFFLGYWLLVEPMAGVVSLTIIMAGGMLAQGFVKISMAFQIRHVSPWPGVLMSGFLSIGLGVFMLVYFQETVSWVLGLIFGADLLVTGSSLLAVACAAYCQPEHELLNALVHRDQVILD